MTAGPLALVGGDELHPGNETQDRVLVESAGGGPAFVLATAAARHRPEVAVENARRWFADLGLAVEELPATRRSHATSVENARRARTGRFFYLVGGDPGIVPRTLAGSPLWRAVVEAWRAGATLAGSSAGAMALGEWTLVRARMPGDERRRYARALAVVPGVAVLPHYDTFGHRWVESALAAAPGPRRRPRRAGRTDGRAVARRRVDGARRRRRHRHHCDWPGDVPLRSGDRRSTVARDERGVTPSRCPRRRRVGRPPPGGRCVGTMARPRRGVSP